MAFLDNLVKDIVAATPAFDLAPLVPKLRDYLRVVNPFKRQFLIAWIAVLASVPDLDMLGALPQLLEGLLAMLSDPNRCISRFPVSSLAFICLCLCKYVFR